MKGKAIKEALSSFTASSSIVPFPEVTLLKKAALLLLAAAMLLLCSTSLCAATNYDILFYGNSTGAGLYDLLLFNDTAAVAVGYIYLPMQGGVNPYCDALLLWANTDEGVVKTLAWGSCRRTNPFYQGWESAYSVARHPSGDIIVVGESRYDTYYSTILRLKPNGSLVYAKKWYVNLTTDTVTYVSVAKDAVALPDGDIVIFGSRYVARFDENLTDMRWGYIFKKGKAEPSIGVAALDLDENCIYMAYSSNGTIYAALDFGTFVKINLTDGSIIWCKSLTRTGGASANILYSAVVPVGDGFIAVGIDQSGLAYPNITAVRIDSNGSFMWIREYAIVEGGAAFYTASQDAVLHNSLCYVLGYTSRDVGTAVAHRIPFIFTIDPSSGASSPLAQGFDLRYVVEESIGKTCFTGIKLAIDSEGRYWFYGDAMPGSLHNYTLDIECTRHPWAPDLVITNFTYLKLFNITTMPEDVDPSVYQFRVLPQDSIDFENYNGILVYPSETVTFWWSFPADGWHLFSVPVTPPGGGIPLDVFLKGFEGSYIAFTWNSSMRRYVDVDELEPGKGYWLYLSGSFIARVKGTPVYNLTLDLPAGWNMVGSIYGKDATASGTNLYPSFFIWSTEKNDYVECSSLPEGYGAWMLAYKPTTVQLT